MSDTTATDDTKRPWHGTDNPFEALWAHFTAEIAALKAKVDPPVPDAEPSTTQVTNVGMTDQYASPPVVNVVSPAPDPVE